MKTMFWDAVTLCLGFGMLAAMGSFAGGGIGFWTFAVLMALMVFAVQQAQRRADKAARHSRRRTAPHGRYRVAGAGQTSHSQKHAA